MRSLFNEHDYWLLLTGVIFCWYDVFLEMFHNFFDQKISYEKFTKKKDRRGF